MPDTTVKCFRSSDAGAPSGGSGSGNLIGLLNACLIDGYGSKTLSSLVVASGVATATVSTGHEFANFGDTGVGPVVLIAGSAVTELNGEKRINVTSATTFTFDATGVSDGTAGGTITAKIAPLGWVKAFSQTNVAAYKSADELSTQCLLRVNDSLSAYATVRGYEAMLDADTGTGPFPTDAMVSGGGVWWKNSTWILVGDHKTLFLITGNSWVYGFGDFESINVADNYNCFIGYDIGTSNQSNNRFGLLGSNSSGNPTAPRSYSQTGGAVILTQYAGRATSGAMGNSSFESYPSLNGGHFLYDSPILTEGNSLASQTRGWMRGLIAPLHTYTSFSDAAIIPGDVPVIVYTVNISSSSTNGAVGIKLLGPW